MRCELRVFLDEKTAREFNKEPGWYVCPREGPDVTGITRCKTLCKTHFSKLKADNKIRHEGDIEITEDCTPLKFTKGFIRPLVKESDFSNNSTNEKENN